MISRARHSLLRAAFGAAPLACVLLAACSVDETVSPVGAATTTTTATDTTSTTQTTTPPDHGPLKRTVSVRSPLAGPANNLLFDGDFEMSVSYGTGQYGWRMFNADGTGEIPMAVETGGLCRSGVTCVKVRKGELLLGRGTAAANGKGHVMELWAKMPEGTGCNKIQAIAIACDTFVVLKTAKADPEKQDGWCHHSAAFNPSTSSICMYIQTSLLPEEEAILDGAVLGPNDGTVPLKETVTEPLDEGSLARMSNVRDYVRRTTRLGKPGVPGPDSRF